jgi:general secretion pathway protein H
MTSRADPRGFTLFELLVVLAIMGLMVTLVVARGPLVSRNLSARQAATELASALREARSEAIGSDRSVALSVDRVARTFTIGASRAHPLPGGFSIALRTAAGEVRNDQVAAIRFEPDGSSTGGRILLDEGGRTYRIAVDWLNGRITVTDG